MRENYLKLCLITNINNTPLSTYKNFLMEAIEGGITCVQLREKSKNSFELYNIALELKSLLSHFKIPFFINDNVKLAKEIDADGVHLGQTDCEPQNAHNILGASKIIGLSIETIAQLKMANQMKCINYVAASAIFPSTTKTNCKTIWGLDGLHHFTQLSKHPVIAIGGIDKNNVNNVIKNGATGVAIVNAIHSQKHPKNTVIDIINQIRLGASDHA